jgi:CRP-like cAMP-binding protein
VSSCELDLTAFETVLRDRPQIARKLFVYFTRDLAQRLRVLHEDLRRLAG